MFFDVICQKTLNLCTFFPYNRGEAIYCMIKVGLVLSGALAKGAYQVGFIDALVEKIGRESIVGLSGASIGACNAYGLAANKMDAIKSVWANFNYPSIFSIWKGIVLKNHTDKVFNVIFDDSDQLDIPLYVSSVSTFPALTFHYVKLEGKYHPDMRKFMKGAVGFPILTGGPKLYRKRLHTDGGVMDNIPIYPLTTLDVDLIIVLHFDPKFELEKRLQLSKKTILEIDLSVCNNYLKQSFDFKQETLSKMYESAYQYGKVMLDRLFSDYDHENIKKRVHEIMAEESSERTKYKALDTWPSRMNRLFHKYRHKPDVITTLEAQYMKTPPDKEVAYCEDCLKTMNPAKHFNWVFFAFTWWFGLGLFHFIHYRFFAKKVCPYCKKRHFEVISPSIT